MAANGELFTPAEHDGFVAGDWEGLVTYRVDGDSCEVTLIETDPRGRGTGDVLLAAVGDAARQAGCSRVWLVTTNDNVDALGWYRRRGFRVVAVREGAVRSLARDAEAVDPDAQPRERAADHRRDRALAVALMWACPRGWLSQDTEAWETVCGIPRQHADEREVVDLNGCGVERGHFGRGESEHETVANGVGKSEERRQRWDVVAGFDSRDRTLRCACGSREPTLGEPADFAQRKNDVANADRMSVARLSVQGWHRSERVECSSVWAVRMTSILRFPGFLPTIAGRPRS